MSIVSNKCIQFSEHGDPTKVLSLTEHQLNVSQLGGSQVLVKWLATPINPLDINIIQGTYSNLPQLPAIPGSEGVAVVEKTGFQVHNLNKGDRVISIRSTGTGIWTEYSIVDAHCLLKIDSSIDLVSAATLMINPPTAYVMLTHFAKLIPGDWIIQNSANSGVGRSVIQIARVFGFKTINLIRDRPGVDALKLELQQLGADHVFTEEEFKKCSKQFLKELDQPIQLGLNGVGGRSALIVSSALAYGATLLTYGGMSKKPSEISTSSFVFKNLKAYGIGIGPWMGLEENQKFVQSMFQQLQKMILAGQLKPIPVDINPMVNFEEAIKKSVQGGCKKQLFVFDRKSEVNINKL